MRVGIVMPLAEQLGGAELALLHLLGANAAKPQQTYSLAFLEHGSMVEQVAGLGCSTKVIPAGRLRQPGRFIATVLRLRKWMVREQLDGVLSWMAKGHLYAGPAAQMAGLPAVWWQHGLPDGHWMDRLVSRVPAVEILACSEATKAAQLRLRPSSSVRVIYPAVELERYSGPRLQDQRTIRRRLGLPESALVVGIVARLQRWKGIHLVLEAAAHLRNSVPEFLVVVVGGPHSLEPDYAAWVRGYADQLGVSGRTVFAGHQTNVPEWMAAMDVMVSASQNEPFGMVIIEAMALGKPVVAVRAGGPAEIIRHDHDGLLMESNRPDQLAEALRRLLGDSDLRRRLGARARVRAQEFGTSRLAHEVGNALHSVLA
jgi:glycosyltransferase involved in cell wall biosynthesis